MDDGDGDGKTRPKPRVRMLKWSDWRSALTSALLGQRDLNHRIGEVQPPSSFRGSVGVGSPRRQANIGMGIGAGMRASGKSVLSLAALASSTSLANLADAAGTSISGSLSSSLSLSSDAASDDASEDDDDASEDDDDDDDDDRDRDRFIGERSDSVFKRSSGKKSKKGKRKQLTNVERFLKYGAEVEDSDAAKAGAAEKRRKAALFSKDDIFAERWIRGYRSNYRNWRKGGAKGAKGGHADKAQGGSGHANKVGKALRMLENMAMENDVFASEDPSEIQVLQKGYSQWRKGKHKGAAATAVLRCI